jgi:hypothetical protein
LGFALALGAGEVDEVEFTCSDFLLACFLLFFRRFDVDRKNRMASG